MQRPDGDAPSLPCAHALQYRLWQLRVRLPQKVKAVCKRPCSQHRNLPCRWRLSHKPLGSQYGESEEPSVFLRRDFILCNFVAKLATQHTHPSCRAVFHTSFPYRYQFPHIGSSTCRLISSNSRTATPHKVAPYYPLHTHTNSTLPYHTPYLRSAA